MLYNFDTYKLYLFDSVAKGSARIKVTMKEPVDPEILRTSVNKAIKRYPYFAVKLSVDPMGGFVLTPNDNPVVLVDTSDNMPMLGSRETNEHLLFADYRGKNIYFNISHSLAGAKGYMPWVFTTIYEYVRECFKVEVEAPEINKPESIPIPGECVVPSSGFCTTDTENFEAYSGHGGRVLLEDILQEYLNPSKRSYEYRTFRFEEDQIIAFAKENRTTVAGVFLMLMAKMLDAVLPDENTPICGGIVHNPAIKWGIPHTHCDIFTNIVVDYERSMLRGDVKSMGEYTTTLIKKQTDAEYTWNLFKKKLELMDKIDETVGLDAKRRCARAGLGSTLPSQTISYVVSYGGLIKLGGLKDYVDSYYNIIGGNMTLTLTAMEGKIFATFIQNIREEKYVKALCDVFDRAGFTYTMNGPFKQHLASHDLFF